MMVLEEAVEYIKALDLLYPNYNLTYVSETMCYLDEEVNLIAPTKATEAGLAILGAYNKKQLELFTWNYKNRTTLRIKDFIKAYYSMRSDSLAARLLTYSFESITQEECISLLTSSDDEDVYTFNTVITDVKDNEIKIKQRADFSESYATTFSKTHVIDYLLSCKGDKFNIRIKDIKEE